MREAARFSWLKTQMLMSPPKPCRRTTGGPSASPTFRYWSSCAADLDGLRFGTAGLLLFGDEVLLELLDVSVDVGVRHGGVGDHAEQAPDRDDVSLLGDLPPQDTGAGCLDGVVDLLALYLDDLVAAI